MKRFIDDSIKVDLILTSPPYNTARKPLKSNKGSDYNHRYDCYFDVKDTDEYIKWTLGLFEQFDRVLSDDGVVLYNISYSSDSIEKGSLMWLVVADIIRNTNFCVADRIIWKKPWALPVNTNKNKLTRIVEDVFVFCRKDEYRTFNCNKRQTSVTNGEAFYSSIKNFVEAKNNDGSNPLNKSTFSTELCLKLLEIYASSDCVVYDPFMGTGTTAVACKTFGMSCYGSEISSKQCDYANDRLKKISANSVSLDDINLFE